MADDHKHGNMDITEQEKTFEGFVKASIWVAGVAIFVLVFLAIFNS
ncbi:aa3-type cytochrome c oxidase subunit IV [Rhodosalinus halophilus]|uniref:Aa3-type cytochrome c oxidase subunit IV n=1 Tax=Rhodosalinus halophilus TaxID=2259333 RepID=A0A365U9P2_9RHOB|nr:aa3-type cytochrome c oxidase subunit IV [Rhodosalinus halophilus]RBI85725.1 aa3-type cytochrome c oxidase subunit IV [Rhodosalinus halophilus]